MHSTSGYSHHDDPLEVLFGLRKGDHFRFEIQGLTCPDADTDWYRSQLNVVISICVGNCRDECSVVMFSDDFHLFKIALKRLLSGETDFASLETGDYLAVDLRCDSNSCKVMLKTDALERENDPAWRIAIDRTSLDALADDVTQVSSRYPTWSVPRRTGPA